VTPLTTVVGYPVPVSPVGLYSKPETSTPFKRTVQPPLAVTIWFPWIFNWGGAAQTAGHKNKLIKIDLRNKFFKIKPSRLCGVNRTWL
jgi:hypothetical protein